MPTHFEQIIVAFEEYLRHGASQERQANIIWALKDYEIWASKNNNGWVSHEQFIIELLERYLEQFPHLRKEIAWAVEIKLWRIDVQAPTYFQLIALAERIIREGSPAMRANLIYFATGKPTIENGREVRERLLDYILEHEDDSENLRKILEKFAEHVMWMPRIIERVLAIRERMDQEAFENQLVWHAYHEDAFAQQLANWLSEHDRFQPRFAAKQFLELLKQGNSPDSAARVLWI